MPAKKKATRKKRARPVPTTKTIAQEIDAMLVIIQNRWVDIAKLALSEGQRLAGK